MNVPLLNISAILALFITLINLKKEGDDMEIIVICIIFGTVGLGCEVVFTAIGDHKLYGNRYLFGRSSLLYFPLYGILVPAAYWIVYPYIGGMSIIFRVLLYGIMLQFGEYIGMMTLSKIFGSSPTEESYLASGRSIGGFTRWDYYLAFCSLGYLYEWIYKIIIY